MPVTISVIVPVYNKAASLAACMDSLFCQSLPVKEVIVVDDGSTDGSLSVVERYAADPRLHIVSQANAGVSAARNRGLAAASGEYVLFVDGDDLLDPEAVSIWSEILEQKRYDLICGGERVVSDGTTVEEEKPSKQELAGYGFLEACLRDATVTHHVWANCYRREFLQGIAFDERHGTHEDWEFNFRCAMKQPSCIVVPDIVYSYTKSDSGCSRSPVTKKKIDDMRSVAEGAKQAVHDRVPQYQELAENLVLKSNMAILAVCPEREAAKTCIRYVQLHRQYFIANSRTDRVLFFLVCHHLYWVYCLAYRIRFGRR